MNLVEEHLKIFNINIKDDIVAITTDGRNVMIKVGNLMPCFQQRCFAHGIQLAIIDVLYKHLAEEKDQDQGGPRRFQEIHNANQSELSDVDDDDDEGGFVVDCTPSSVKIASNYKNLIKKVRKIVKIFKKSLTKNDLILQKYIQEEHGKRLDFILDCKTRWKFGKYVRTLL